MHKIYSVSQEMRRANTKAINNHLNLRFMQKKKSFSLNVNFVEFNCNVKKVFCCIFVFLGMNLYS